MEDKVSLVYLGMLSADYTRYYYLTSKDQSLELCGRFVEILIQDTHKLYTYRLINNSGQIGIEWIYK